MTSSVWQSDSVCHTLTSLWQGSRCKSRRRARNLPSTLGHEAKTRWFPTKALERAEFPRYAIPHLRSECILRISYVFLMYFLCGSVENPFFFSDVMKLCEWSVNIFFDFASTAPIGAWACNPPVLGGNTVRSSSWPLLPRCVVRLYTSGLDKSGTHERNKNCR